MRTGVFGYFVAKLNPWPIANPWMPHVLDRSHASRFNLKCMSLMLCSEIQRFACGQLLKAGQNAPVDVEKIVQPRPNMALMFLKSWKLQHFTPHTHTHALSIRKKYISLLTLKGLWLPTRAATEMIGSQGANWRMECMSSREFLRAHKLSQPRHPFTMVVERTCVDLVLI